MIAFMKAGLAPLAPGMAARPFVVAREFPQ